MEYFEEPTEYEHVFVGTVTYLLLTDRCPNEQIDAPKTE